MKVQMYDSNWEIMKVETHDNIFNEHGEENKFFQELLQGTKVHLVRAVTLIGQYLTTYS